MFKTRLQEDSALLGRAKGSLSRVIQRASSGACVFEKPSGVHHLGDLLSNMR